MGQGCLFRACGGGKPNLVMNTDNADDEPTWAGTCQESDEDYDEENRVFEAYMTAKHQYRDILRITGPRPRSGRHQEGNGGQDRPGQEQVLLQCL